MKKTGEQVVLITGGTSGIGQAIAGLFRQKEHATVYTLSRRPMEDPYHLQVDVTDEKACKAAVAAVKEKSGRIDVLINCAGSGISGAAEFTSYDQALFQINVNLLGTANMTKAVLSLMREQGGGRIVNVSSVAAPIPIPFQSWYSASKAAINAYTMALANEVRSFDISVCAVMPGDTSTGFTAARQKNMDGDDVYGGMIDRSVARMEHDEQSGVSPVRAAEEICRICRKRHVKPLYALGFTYKVFAVVMKLLPCRLSNWMIGQLYAKKA